MKKIQDVNVAEIAALDSPSQVKLELPVFPDVRETVFNGRAAVRRIVDREDPRMLVVVGPCSIHDPEAAMEYAKRLADLRRELADQLFIVMRVYFEKPRTVVGWKGLINDPRLDGSGDVASGLRLARKLLLDINGLGLPAATEMLDPIIPQYIAELVSWGAIGARTTESQTHREMASGLSMPVGFKNGTDGSIQVAIDAMRAAREPHSFLGIDNDGRIATVRTTGNRWGHIVLRGGRDATNYDAQSVRDVSESLKSLELEPAIMIDCSHANSGKKFTRQEGVWNAVVEHRLGGNEAVIGAMIESNLHEGNQEIQEDPSQLRYGVSITDECVDWETTERMLRHGHEQLTEMAAGRARTS